MDRKVDKVRLVREGLYWIIEKRYADRLYDEEHEWECIECCQYDLRDYEDMVEMTKKLAEDIRIAQAQDEPRTTLMEINLI